MTKTALRNRLSMLLAGFSLNGKGETIVNGLAQNYGVFSPYIRSGEPAMMLDGLLNTAQPHGSAIRAALKRAVDELDNLYRTENPGCGPKEKTTMKEIIDAEKVAAINGAAIGKAKKWDKEELFFLLKSVTGESWTEDKARSCGFSFKRRGKKLGVAAIEKIVEAIKAGTPLPTFDEAKASEIPGKPVEATKVVVSEVKAPETPKLKLADLLAKAKQIAAQPSLGEDARMDERNFIGDMVLLEGLTPRQKQRMILLAIIATAVGGIHINELNRQLIVNKINDKIVRGNVIDWFRDFRRVVVVKDRASNTLKLVARGPLLDMRREPNRVKTRDGKMKTMTLDEKTDAANVKSRMITQAALDVLSDPKKTLLAFAEGRLPNQISVNRAQHMDPSRSWMEGDTFEEKDSDGHSIMVGGKKSVLIVWRHLAGVRSIPGLISDAIHHFGVLNPKLVVPKYADDTSETWAARIEDFMSALVAACEKASEQAEEGAVMRTLEEEEMEAAWGVLGIDDGEDEQLTAEETAALRAQPVAPPSEGKLTKMQELLLRMRSK